MGNSLSNNINKDNILLKEYEKEFYDAFEIIDDDADIKPYDLKTQVLIQNFLILSIKVLEKNKKENSYLIQEAETLKNNIQNYTKRKTVKSLSLFLAKTRKKGLLLLKEILNVAKKELIKRGVNGGFDTIIDLLN